jgi:hypothetical protein
MPARLSLVLLISACTGQIAVVVDSGEEDAPICTFDSDFHCDYRSSEIFATCVDYSGQAFDYLDAQSVDDSGSGLADSCAANGATWGEGACPMDDTWVGVCVTEVGGTVGLVYGTHYYSEPQLSLPDGTVIIYDDETASEICAESAGAEWCNDSAE